MLKSCSPENFKIILRIHKGSGFDSFLYWLKLKVVFVGKVLRSWKQRRTSLGKPSVISADELVGSIFCNFSRKAEGGYAVKVYPRNVLETWKGEAKFEGFKLEIDEDSCSGQ